MKILDERGLYELLIFSTLKKILKRRKRCISMKKEEGFIEEDEEILSEEDEKELKEKLEYYGYI